MREIMDNKKIFIVNLAKGKIGEDYSALLGAMLITKIQLAAMGRTDIPEEDRKDFYLYVDEFQNFATESFAGILSEARKYRLNLIVAHQYIGQLEEEVSDAIFGNIGTLIAFRVGAADAEYLEKEYEPVFMMNDLVNLGKYNIYLKLMIDGVAGDAFSATTLPPNPVPEKSNVEKVIKVSRERYTSKREVVEEKISRWPGIEFGEEKGVPEEKGEKSNGKTEGPRYAPKLEKTDREMWDAVRKLCGEKIKVPFKPDPNRDTFCRNCLIDVRKQTTEHVEKRDSGNIAAATRPEVKEKISGDTIAETRKDEAILAVKSEKKDNLAVPVVKKEIAAKDVYNKIVSKVSIKKTIEEKAEKSFVKEKIERVEIIAPQVVRAKDKPKAIIGEKKNGDETAKPLLKVDVPKDPVKNLPQEKEQTKTSHEKTEIKEGETVRFAV